MWVFGFGAFGRTIQAGIVIDSLFTPLRNLVIVPDRSEVMETTFSVHCLVFL